MSLQINRRQNDVARGARQGKPHAVAAFLLVVQHHLAQRIEGQAVRERRRQPNAGKERPDIFLECAWRLGAEPEDIAVFEDAYYAARTAKMAGFYVVGVYDEDNDRHWKDMARVCDETVMSLEEMMYE